MLPKRFEDLPELFQKEAVKPYYEILDKRRVTLSIKRLCDLLFALVAIIILSPILIIAAILVKCTSKGTVFYLQPRIGMLGREFKIHKFRTMVANADKTGAAITVGKNDSRITKFGAILRITRIDELPQLIDIILGHMTLIGARPEVKKFVDEYSDEMRATLILRPCITGNASIEFRNENDMLFGKENPEQYYVDEILPIKMAINLRYLKEISFFKDIRILIDTFLCIFR